MPNHCYNKITISVGDADEKSLEILVDTLKSKENETDFDFNAILPMPPELESLGWSKAEDLNDIEKLTLENISVVTTGTIGVSVIGALNGTAIAVN